MTGSHLFIADLHLDPENQCVSELAMRFLQKAHGKQHLYILGDLFEYWLGDDVGLPVYTQVLEEFRQLRESGCGITVMHGNRDFLLGEAFAESAGACLVRDDEMIITLGDEPVLLMHGDTLCTDDVDYQRFRHNLREPRWQKQFLAKSVDERRDHAEAMRAASHDASAAKSAVIMDVNAAAVTKHMQASNCHTLIHGHTHRPAVHSGIQPGDTRWVVGDWHDDSAQYVQWDGHEFSLNTFR
ncbi:UDP-2,3-diacylglucosamine diphosphatase [Granulosicoccus antarcticus]|uniref:UDP-2,3-diacylglucosamine hydrolase n=1 Tax=Granulosicoccus antarcticus IMCC3135 TaxID=1192854 RepID=A0A2Z2NT17_9GAMM|nr:UDP-2,3-diacylglucosamine diphosphatase [Granulosicoccus antarcticus]ASJ74449.1 UDP-2,3-diacylglucosamine hydrolase [Granulosicoccus antarcticus IMCC3135]